MTDEARQNMVNRIRIREDLELFTGGALSRHANVDELISRIAALDRPQQDFVYEWSELIARSNNELAAHFISLAPKAFGQMESDGVQDWLDEAITTFDNRGLGSAIEILENVDTYAAEYAGRHMRCGFDDASVFLRHFIRGLGGREMRIASDPETFTDTESLYLPDAVNLFPMPEQNFTLYKLTATHLWAQTWYGTWRYQIVERLLRHYDNETTLPIFNRLESIRLEACIARDLPGLAREIDAFRDADPATVASWALWRERAAELLEKKATADDSLRLLPEFEGLALPPLQPFHGEMYANKVREALFARIEREKAAFQRALNELNTSEDGQSNSEGDDSQKQMVDVEMIEDDNGDGSDVNFQISIDGEIVNLPEHLKELMGSIMQDFGEIPDDHLDPTELGQYSDDLLPQGADADNDSDIDPDAKGTFTYHEWDCVRQAFAMDFVRYAK